MKNKIKNLKVPSGSTIKSFLYSEIQGISDCSLQECN